MGAAAVPRLSSTTWRPYLREAEVAAVVSGSLGAVSAAAAALGAAADPMRPSTTAPPPCLRGRPRLAVWSCRPLTAPSDAYLSPSEWLSCLGRPKR